MEDGMLRDSLAEMVALDDAPVPIGIEADDETTPEEAAVPLDKVKVGKMPEEADKEALAEMVALSVPVGRGAERLTEPETVAEGKMPDDRRPDENSDATLDAMLLSSEVGTGRGIDAVGWLEAVIAEESADSALDTKLDTTLGRADPVGRSETADDRRLESSEITDGTREGRIPDTDGDGVIVADPLAVGLTDPELGIIPVGNSVSDGSTPVTSETTEERIEGRLTSPELAETPSDVGIAPDGEAWLVGVADAESVPSAVVRPIVIPPDDAPPVGSTMLLGRIPVPMVGVAVASTLPKIDDNKEPTRPADDEAGRIDSEAGKPPVEAT
jgi:hypothetical protein